MDAGHQATHVFCGLRPCAGEKEMLCVKIHHRHFRTRALPNSTLTLSPTAHALQVGAAAVFLETGTLSLLRVLGLLAAAVSIIAWLNLR